MSEITIVMYHYVREIERSDYPNIKGLEFKAFRRQLNFIQDNYTVIPAEDLIAYAEGDLSNLPDKSCLLTFDDGYKDHFDYVLPELSTRNIKGLFFPVTRCAKYGDLIDVNAIHYILACCDDPNLLVETLRGSLLALEYEQSFLDKTWNEFGHGNGFDNAATIYFKRMLQKVLPAEIREVLVRDFFEKFVPVSCEELARTLYMNERDLRELIREGMYVGSHTYSHPWLNSLNAVSQEQEIDQSLQFLAEIGASVEDWIMAYPYGGYNSETIEILKRKSCRIGLTTEFGTAFEHRNTPLELSRLDTNHLPQ